LSEIWVAIRHPLPVTFVSERGGGADADADADADAKVCGYRLSRALRTQHHPAGASQRKARATGRIQNKLDVDGSLN
jgi:hypothetical protein